MVIDELHYDTEFVLYRQLESTKGVELRIAKHSEGAIDIRAFLRRGTDSLTETWSYLLHP